MSNGRWDAAVTGLGLVTPGGIGVPASWNAILAGASTAASDPELAGMPVDFTCRVPGFDADELLGRRVAWRLDRYVHLALVAAREAIADSGLDPREWDGSRVGVVMGNALGGVRTFEEQHCALLREGAKAVSSMLIPMMGVNMVAGYIAIDCGARGPNLVTTTACASGTTAIGTARELIRTGRCDVVIAGGAEAGLTRPILAGFTRMGALSRRIREPALASRPFDRDRDGFVAAEGAGVLVLERMDHANARRARVRARVVGYGASADAHHATAPDPSGAGVEKAIRMALHDAGIEPREVDHVNAHGTSTPLNDVTEARAVCRVFPGRPAVTSIKGVTGHSLGAAGAIEAACTVLSIEQGTIPPTANLDRQDPDIDLDVVSNRPRAQRISVAASNSFGFGGQNAVLVLAAA
ncbi:MAG TPA: beta-ketoacyl-[acyl-carrier-protein] synthase family protein [Actinophytocola sp.]|uniref:beta-ketoacyl-[acyl-carrier-protein] synthase family protein n=1 Tax=Actinophytocola sp. TaxID=1872138 RepID=UPI002DDD4ADA|nr:beta-ketoacyl-[acyl-carrier-protein] synthase family protein [Actinophytocola sp.]HEV2779906.1 beta-ketoacyl-[acyl-carrier-protein] synthase family protein [Actinophytocola sp.]